MPVHRRATGASDRAHGGERRIRREGLTHADVLAIAGRAGEDRDGRVAAAARDLPRSHVAALGPRNQIQRTRFVRGLDVRFRTSCIEVARACPIAAVASCRIAGDR